MSVFTGSVQDYIGGIIMPRKYEKVQELLPVVRQLAGNGWTQRQIAEKMGLSGKEVVKGLLKRERKRK